MNSTQVASLKTTLRCILIGCVILTTLVVVSVIVFGQLGRFELKVILSALAATGVSILTLFCAPQMEQHRKVALSGMGFASLAFVLTLCAIWIERDCRWSTELWRYVASAWVGLLTFAYLCKLLSCTVAGWTVTLRKVASVVGILWALITIVVIFDPTCLGMLEEATVVKTSGILAAIATGSAFVIFIASWLKK